MVYRYQIEEKCKELLFDVSQNAYTEIQRLLASGAIDFEQYEDNYLLPKMLLCVALKRVADSYSPMHYDTQGLKELKNLEHF